MLRLFEKFGIELEYMIVRNADCSVAPIADKLISDFCGAPLNECEVGGCGLSNELAAHVIELKSASPTSDFKRQEEKFVEAITRINRQLESRGARLLPGPMHPAMNPATESFTWPHEGREIYSLYDSIFNCRSHGWLNLQSSHINLPFAGDHEFALLHSAVILLLPLMPALTAGSPFRERVVTGLTDTRLEIYEHNQDLFPSITGEVIPEAVLSRAEYEEKILQPMFRETAEVDPEGIIRHEWLNSRGAIARFDRNAIEVRLLDVQECPAADLALAQFFIAALRHLVEGRESDLEQWVRHSSARERRRQLDEVIRSGTRAPIVLSEIPEAFGLAESVGTAGGFWRHVFEKNGGSLPAPAAAVIERILNTGNLSTRLLTAHQQLQGSDSFHILMDALARCLSENRLFDPSACNGD